MKKTALGFAAALALGLASLTVPASAMTIAPGAAVHTSSDVTTVQFRHKHRQVCSVRTVVSRGHHGKRIVKKVRVCR